MTKKVINRIVLTFLILFIIFYIYPYLDKPTLNTSFDKYEMYLKIDESLPETKLYDKNTDLTKLKYPIVFKPDNGEVSYMVEVINSKEEAIKYIDKFPHENNRIIIQEYVPHNNEVGLFVYKSSIYNDYEILSLVEKKDDKIIKPGCSSFKEGVSCFDITHKVTPQLRDKIIRIIKKCNYVWGRFDIKYETTEKLLNGEFYIMEINHHHPTNYQMSMNAKNPIKFIYYTVITVFIQLRSILYDMISKFFN